MVVASFLSCFVAWAITFVALIAWRRSTTAFGYVTDFDALYFWTLVFALLGWLVVALPILRRLPNDSRLLRFPVSVLAGGGVTLAFYSATLGWAFYPLGDVSFAAMAAGVGMVGLPVYAAVYPLVHRSAHLTTWWGRTAALAAPFAVLVLLSRIVWPAVVEAAPSFAYYYSGLGGQQRIVRSLLQKLSVGDSIAPLRQQLPDAFPNSTASYWAGGMYNVTLENDVITNLEFE